MAKKNESVAVGGGGFGWVGWGSVLAIFFIIFASNWQLVGADDIGPAELKCNTHNDSCASCLDASGCYWCGSDSGSCHHYEYLSAGTYFKKCSWGNARWQTCWLNVEALVITSSVLAGLLLISCCYCYCVCRGKCRRAASRRMERAEVKLERAAGERQERNADRTAARRANADQIRQKYGIPRSGPNYDSLENEG